MHSARITPSRTPSARPLRISLNVISVCSPRYARLTHRALATAEGEGSRKAGMPLRVASHQSSSRPQNTTAARNSFALIR